MSFRMRVCQEARGKPPVAEVIAEFAGHVCESLRTAGAEVTKPTLLAALDEMTRVEWTPNGACFADLAREELATRRLLVDALRAILESLSLDTDLPLAEEIAC